MKSSVKITEIFFVIDEFFGIFNEIIVPHIPPTQGLQICL